MFLRTAPVFQRSMFLATMVLLASLAGIFSSEVFAEEAGFHWEEREPGSLDLVVGKQPVLRYMLARDTSTEQRAHETFKVYHHVFGPGTEAIITKGPGGLYTHHRGLFVGWSKTRFEGTSLDFWHCTKGAHLKHVKFLAKEGGTESGTMTALIHWNDAEGEPVIEETRTVAASRLPDASERKGWQIDWQTELVSKRGEIELDGDRQHAGFQFRANQAVAESKGARYVRPAGFPDKPEAFQVGDKGDPPAHINLGWLAMTYEMDGNRYTIEYFEDPTLPKPSLYSERPYGRFGAFFKATITEAQPLKLRYRINVVAGKTSTQAEIQTRYNEFLAESKAK